MAVGPTGDEYRGPRSQRVATWETKCLAAHFADEHPAGHVLRYVAQIDDGNDCWQSAKVGQIRTREDYYYEELRGSSLRVLL